MTTKRRTLGEEHNQCPACSAYFNSTYAFDMHRIGEFGRNRRCMTETEMLNAGMGLNKTKWWVSALQEGLF